MVKKSQIERITQAHQDNKLLVVGEIAALALLTIRSRLWEDPALITKSDRTRLGKEKVTGWIYAYPSKVTPLKERLLEVEGTEEFDRLMRLKEKLESIIGATAMNALTQVRNINIGQVPYWKSRGASELSAQAQIVGVQNEDESFTYVQEIVEQGDVELPRAVTIHRLKRVMQGLAERATGADTVT